MSEDLAVLVEHSWVAVRDEDENPLAGVRLADAKVAELAFIAKGNDTFLVDTVCAHPVMERGCPPRSRSFGAGLSAGIRNS